MSGDILDEALKPDSAYQLGKVFSTFEARASQSEDAREEPWHRIQGPFGVFSTARTGSLASTPPQQDAEKLVCPEWSGTPSPSNNVSDSFTVWEELNDLDSAFPRPSFLDSEDVHAGVSTTLASAPYAACEYLDAQPEASTTDQQVQALDLTWQNDPGSELELRQQPDHQAVPPALTTIDLPESDSPYLPTSARYLLWHYAKHTIPSLSSSTREDFRSPWHELHLPTALKAYAELNVLGNSNLARVSVLYSILSITCFQLRSLHRDGSQPSGLNPSYTTSSFHPGRWKADDWEKQAHKFKNIAQTGLNKCLQNASVSPRGESKYKEVFLAALNLVCLRIVSGHTADAPSYILQCEEIVRKIGAHQPRSSRKAADLHRMFLYIQVMESASSGHPRSRYPKHLESALRETDENALVTFLPDNVGQEESHGRLTRASLRDLHLGEAEDEFQEAIWGMPDSLLRLIGRATELIDDIEESTCINHGDNSPGPSAEMEQRISSLENSICLWSVEKSSNPSGELLSPSITASEEIPIGSNLDTQQQMQDSFSRAVHSALLIYFFRSIRKTHPVILQHYVEIVLRNLEIHTRLKTQYAPARLNIIVWPSFIAACEAIGGDLRRRSIECLRQAAWAGFCNWEAAEQVTNEVWRRRDAGNVTASWQDVVRELQVNMVLT